MLLKLSDVHVNYGNIKAVKGIDIAINEGEVVTLIGSNGAGKTTIMKTISGLLKPVKGTILFKGQDITNKSSPEIVRLGISLSPEGRQIFPKMTILENLELGGYTRSKTEMNEGLEKIYSLFPRLKERMNQDAGTLSGGEQQMLAIGRALMAKPSLLLLDEPSMGLAPIMVQTIFDIIKEINQLGTTILLVEQNARMALMAADRGYLLETGKVVMTDKAENLANSDNIIKAYLGEKEEE
ncbi:ABC transporter ATP-binding protein [Anaerosolibacter sp.]|uniref:ABC transporter ATP-binding protein n=1 Tax=Anaerosolibacter sp. TaxID=1872527 RepID=UPI0039EDF137